MHDIDYSAWSDESLSDELDLVDKSIQSCQNTIKYARKSMNSFMDRRQDILDAIKQRAQQRG